MAPEGQPHCGPCSPGSFGFVTISVANAPTAVPAIVINPSGAGVPDHNRNVTAATVTTPHRIRPTTAIRSTDQRFTCASSPSSKRRSHVPGPAYTLYRGGSTSSHASGKASRTVPPAPCPDDVRERRFLARFSVRWLMFSLTGRLPGIETPLTQSLHHDPGRAHGSTADQKKQTGAGNDHSTGKHGCPNDLAGSRILH